MVLDPISSYIMADLRWDLSGPLLWSLPSFVLMKRKKGLDLTPTPSMSRQLGASMRTLTHNRTYWQAASELRLDIVRRMLAACHDQGFALLPSKDVNDL